LSASVALPNGRQYALAPQLAPLLPIWNAGKMAALLNVGSLIQPTTKAQYTAKSVPLPPKLFSHNDQQSVWQSSLPEGATSGWGGRIGDLFVSGNGNATFTCVNVSGNAVFLSGATAGAVPGVVERLGGADRDQVAAVRLDGVLERAARPRHRQPHPALRGRARSRHEPFDRRQRVAHRGAGERARAADGLSRRATASPIN
jgi:uncharacterized protein (DUF1501 family)